MEDAAIVNAPDTSVDNLEQSTAGAILTTADPVQAVQTEQAQLATKKPRAPRKQANPKKVVPKQQQQQQ